MFLPRSALQTETDRKPFETRVSVLKYVFATVLLFYVALTPIKSPAIIPGQDDILPTLLDIVTIFYGAKSLYYFKASMFTLLVFPSLLGFLVHLSVFLQYVILTPNTPENKLDYTILALKPAVSLAIVVTAYALGANMQHLQQTIPNPFVTNLYNQDPSLDELVKAAFPDSPRTLLKSIPSSSGSSSEFSKDKFPDLEDRPLKDHSCLS